MPQRAKPYQYLAQHYDDFFQPLRLPIDKARRRLLKKIMPGLHTACDLACGSGTTSLALAGEGLKVYAVDLSPDMCRLTRQKTKGLAVKVLNADMRDFRLPELVDLVTCECDALNHVARKSDLKAVAKAVARALHPGGHFFFDVNNSLAFKTYWAGTHWAEKPGVVMILNNGHNRNADRAWSDVDFFIRDPATSLWQRHQEMVEEVCWTAQEIENTFAEAGFDRIECWDGAPFFKSDTRITVGCRSIYLLRKKK